MSESPLLYLVRHGETDANLARRYAGWSDDHLNERGRAQCAVLAAELAAEGIEAVFTSPVLRAVETAEALASELGARVHTVHDLHEIEIGPWKGLTEDEVLDRDPERFGTWRRSPDTFELEGRESLAGVLERSRRALDQIGHAQLSASAAPAVIVTHLAVLRVLWLTAQGRPLSEYHTVEGPHCRPFPLRWLGRGRIEPAGVAPEG